MPRVLWFEEDPRVLGQPFYVMERVDGVVPSDNPPFAVMGWLAEASREDQARLWRSSLVRPPGPPAGAGDRAMP